MKFQATVVYLAVLVRTTKVLHKTLLDQKSCTSVQDGGHIRLTWPMFDITFFSTRQKIGILISRDEVPRNRRLFDIQTKTSKIALCFKMAVILVVHGLCL